MYRKLRGKLREMGIDQKYLAGFFRHIAGQRQSPFYRIGAVDDTRGVHHHEPDSRTVRTIARIFSQGRRRDES